MTDTKLWCVVSDESGHKYLIENSEKDAFDQWLSSFESAAKTKAYKGQDFSMSILNGVIGFRLPVDLKAVRNRSTGDFEFYRKK